jgi:hypothetical protein
MNRYYIRRHECWGGEYAYSVADAETRKQVSKTFRQERTAKKLRDKMNADYGHLLKATLKAGARRSIGAFRPGACTAKSAIR